MLLLMVMMIMLYTPIMTMIMVVHSTRAVAVKYLSILYKKAKHILCYYDYNANAGDDGEHDVSIQLIM